MAFDHYIIAGGKEIQIRFQPVLMCPNVHQGLLAKAICEYVPASIRTNTCDDVIRALGPLEVSVMVNVLLRK